MKTLATADNDPSLDPWMRAEWWTPMRRRCAYCCAWLALQLLWSLLGVS